MTVDDHLANVGQELGCTVLPGGKLKQLWRFIEEAGRESAGEKLGMRDEVEQKWDVGFDAPDAELLQTALHAPGGLEKPQPVGGDLDQQRVVERRNDRA